MDRYYSLGNYSTVSNRYPRCIYTKNYTNWLLPTLLLYTVHKYNVYCTYRKVHKWFISLLSKKRLPVFRYRRYINVSSNLLSTIT